MADSLSPTPSNFDFLLPAWPALHAEATRAEALVYPDPRTACFYARRALETTMKWLFKVETTLSLPYQENLAALIHEPTFLTLVGHDLQTKARLVNSTGNAAVHHTAPITQTQSFNALRDLFHLTFWLARRYSRTPPPDATKFNADLLPKATAAELALREATTASGKLQREAQQRLADLAAKHEAEQAATSQTLADLEARNQALRDELAQVIAANAARPDTHDYDEAATRDAYIDLLLAEAGWDLDAPNLREFTLPGTGRADYVLWSPTGLPLAVIEAKRTRRSPAEGQQQVKLYADALELLYNQRPILFYTNGYEHQLWDDTQYPPRQVAGFHTLAELELLIQRRTSRKPLLTVETDREIAGRYYQERAIRRIAEAFETRRLRKALLVMATGSGKTRTVIALADLLMRANWAGRILFLADRRTLVTQAVAAFKKHLPSATTVNLVTERTQTGHVYVSTYPTLMNLIDVASDPGKPGTRRFGPGFFDLIVVDEAHRSIYQKYGVIFDYFDALLVGLTATPRDEIDHNTYRFFQLEDGVPTDEYSLAQAITDKFLVPYRVLNTPARIPTVGIRYDELTEEEQVRWDTLEWGDNGEIPDEVEAPAVHQWFFNENTVDLVLAHMMQNGIKVAGGDRLGKTILFAKNQHHAEFIQKRFDHNYPHLAGKFARTITYKIEGAQSLIDDFSQPEKAPHLAISVDMLDTGIDIPDVVNLAFFKKVRSKTKFWQMIGRGTRLRKDLFGPRQDKVDFLICDYCLNFEYFGMNPDVVEGSTTASLSATLFRRRVELIGELDHRVAHGTVHTEQTLALRTAVAETLRSQVSGMSLESFEVRPHRGSVERFSKAEALATVGTEQMADLHPLAALPTSVTDSDTAAKVFDHLILRMQLAMLRAQPAFVKMSEKVIATAALLEAKSTIPMIAAQLDLLQELQGPDFWRNATLSSLEEVRVRLRSLIKLLDPGVRPIITTDFQDELGEHSPVRDLMQAAPPGVDIERFRAKAQHFLSQYEQRQSIQHLKWNERLSAEDLAELDEIFLAEGLSRGELLSLKQNIQSLGLFVRSLVGLDRRAAHLAFQRFLTAGQYSANQMQFVELVCDYLTRQGYVDAAQLYEAPFTNSHPLGISGLFGEQDVNRMLSILTTIKSNADQPSAIA